MRKIYLAVALFLFAFQAEGIAAQAYYTPRVVQSGKVASTQTNFPALVILNDTRYKTIGNGGHVANSNGYDIRFYSDSGLTTPLTYERVLYSASAGTGEFWVLVPSIADATTIYIGYGDAGITTDGSSTSTWPSQYKAVYHFGDGSSLSVNDSTSSANTLTNTGSTATTGKIGGGASLNGSSNHMVTGSNIGISGATARTLSMWINPDDVVTPSNYIFSMGVDDGDKHPFDLAISGGTSGNLYNYNANADIFSAGSTVSSTMAQLVISYDGGNIEDPGIVSIYLDGSFVSLSKGGSATGTLNTSAAVLHIGQYQANSNFYSGIIDEFKVSNTAQTANWITTSYNNESDNAAFWPDETEVSSGACTPDHLTFTDQPANAQLGATLGTVEVSVKDSGGSTCTSDTSNVTLSENGSSTWGTIHSSSSLTKAAVAGVATWTDLYVTGVTGSGSLDAADGMLTGDTSSSITISCTPSKVVFTDQPSNAAQGASLGTVEVTVQNSSSQTCLGDTSSITLSEHTGSTWGTLSSGSSLTKSATAGVATWTDLSIDSAGSGSIDATDGALTVAVSNSITISAGCGAGSGGGITIVQCKQGVAPISGGSGTIVFDSTPTAGNFWIAAVSMIGFSAITQKVTTFADSQSNSATAHLSQTSGASPTPNVSLGSAKIVSTGSSFTVTFTTSDSNDLYGQYVLLEVSGLDPTTWFDEITSTGTGQSSGGSTVTITSGSASTTNNALVIASMSTNNTLTSGATSGYTGLEQDTYQSIAYKFLTSGGTPAASWTMSAGDYDGYVAVFRGIDSAPGTRPRTLTLLGVGD